ncbi:FAD-dependent oxidoreductase, partial [Candidatus Poribacteria bacterium]|nr:FAD-dependent oxidoreductase [Candidatus Poribacteria bacterium]
MRERTRDRVERCTHEFDVCVVGGGMAGMCAAIASARRGARTAIVHDRPVYGGNASSEIRMWICGAHGRNNKETGILEEILLANARRNPAGNYSIWDSVLYEKIHFQPGLTAFLNNSCMGAETERDGDRTHITAIDAWQTTTQVLHTIRASLFIDCSGDSILAADSGARFRMGREARDEFDEDIEPEVGDSKTMGSSLLIQMRKTSEPQPFTPPRWAYTFEGPEDLPHRIRGVHGANFWWLELGGLQDTIRDAESIRHELLKVGYGVWDYIKNRAPERDEAADWGLEWLGSLPGKRESRRYVGDHILSQNDIRDGGQFDDIVAYGGWTMDDHHPAGLLYPGKPTIFHPAPSPYGIPYRCIYSANVDNLLFAGRNISVTHAALSSTRVMATCAVVGQAAGTAAALCVRHGVAPVALPRERTGELQAALMHDDA